MAQFHLKFEAEDLAPHVMLVGNPQRAEQVSKLLQGSRLVNNYRYLLVFTGMYEGERLSVACRGNRQPFTLIHPREDKQVSIVIDQTRTLEQFRHLFGSLGIADQHDVRRKVLCLKLQVKLCHEIYLPGILKHATSQQSRSLRQGVDRESFFAWNIRFEPIANGVRPHGRDSTHHTQDRSNETGIAVNVESATRQQSK